MSLVGLLLDRWIGMGDGHEIAGSMEGKDLENPHYKQLLGSGLLGLFRTTVVGKMLDCNQTLVDLLGYGSVVELCNLPVRELYFDVQERKQFLEALAQKKQLHNYEILLKHCSGKPVHVLESVMFREAPGRPTVIEGVVIDITSVRSAEIEQRLLVNNFRQLSERIRDGILVVQQGKVAFANPAAQKLLGPEEVLGKEFNAVVAPEDAKTMADLLRNADQGESTEGARIHFVRNDGTQRPLFVYATGTWYMNGAGLQITLHDAEAERNLLQERLRTKLAEEANTTLRREIAEHKRTQEALVKSKRLARSLIESSLDVIVAVDSKGMITEFNPAASIKFGREQEEVLGKSSRILYADQETYERVQGEMARYGAYAGEVRNISADGKAFICFLAASKLFDEDGTLIGSMGVSRDVTQAKRDQEALEQSEERYRDLVDNATDLIHSTDMDNNFLFVNNAWKQTFGYTDEELASITLNDILSDEAVRELARKWFDQPDNVPATQTWQAWFLSKDQRRILLEGTSNLRLENGKAVGSRSIMRDITAAHRAQEQLNKHAAKEKALFETSEHMFWSVDSRIALTSFNQGYHDMIVRLHGKAPQTNTDPEKPREFFATQEYHDFWKTKYNEAFAGNSVWFETDVKDLDGQRVCNEIYLSPVQGPDGKVEEVFGIGHEITEKKEAEAQVREKSAKLNAIFESSADVMMWSVDRDFQITACNKFFTQISKQMHGKPIGAGDNIRNTFTETMGQGMDAEWQAMYGACFAGKSQHREMKVVLEGEGEMWMELFLSPIHTDGNVNEVSGLAHDITEKKRIEREVLDSLREKEVLLKEVHHRVKNNLQIISSIFNLQRDHVAGNSQALELLQESRNRIQSMSFIHESLYLNKNFSQVNFAQYIESLCRNLVLSYSLGAKVRLHTGLQPIMLEPDKAIPCGLIMNELISNALKHAFPNGSEGSITIGLKEEGKAVCIAVADDGRGFPLDFSAERDKGLGMELVDMLIGQLEGTVVQNHMPGARGTSYLITFERS